MKVLELLLIIGMVLVCVQRLFLALTPAWFDLFVGIYVCLVMGIGLLGLLRKKWRARAAKD